MKRFCLLFVDMMNKFIKFMWNVLIGIQRMLYNQFKIFLFYRKPIKFAMSIFRMRKSYAINLQKRL